MNTDSKCPVSGFPIFSPPEYHRYCVSDEYKVTFKKIGNNILYLEPEDGATDISMIGMFKIREKFIQTYFQPDHYIVELKNYYHVKKTLDKHARNQFTKFMKRDIEKKRLAGFIGFNASFFIKTAFNVGTKLIPPPYHMSIVQDYNSAISLALDLEKNRHIFDGYIERYTKQEWIVSEDNFYFQLQIINKNIIYIKITGKAKASYINKIMQIQLDAHNEITNKRGIKELIRIQDSSEISEMSLSIRRLYLKRLRNDLPLETCKMGIIIGKNFISRISNHISALVFPYKVYIVSNFEEAMRKINALTIENNIVGSITSDNKNINEEPKIIEDLLAFISTINWDIENTDDAIKKIPQNSLMSDVYSALINIKKDIDFLLKEKENSQNKIKKLNEDLEQRVKIRTAELEESNIKLKDREEIILELNKKLNKKVVDKTSKLKAAQNVIVEKEHQTELADITTSTLHNVKNLLNSVKTSAFIAKEQIHNKVFLGLKKANGLLLENIDTIDDFIQNDPKGKKLLQYYVSLDSPINETRHGIEEHLNRLMEKVDSIENIVTTQQHYGGINEIVKVHMEDMINDAFTMLSSSIESYSIQIKNKVKDSPYVNVQQTKMMHILINIIKNAKESMLEEPEDNRILIFTSTIDEQWFNIIISDTGHGISPQSIKKMFTYGFTTKENGNGYGLHSCLRYMDEMGGKLQVASDGIGKGAVFTIQIPL